MTSTKKQLAKVKGIARLQMGTLIVFYFTKIPRLLMQDKEILKEVKNQKARKDRLKKQRHCKLSIILCQKSLAL